MKHAFFLILLFLFIFPAMAQFPDLKGEYLRIHSFNIDEKEYVGNCDQKALKNSTLQNYFAFGEDTAVLLQDDIVCENNPNFNAIELLPKQQKSAKFKLYLGYGTGVVPGILSDDVPQERLFKLHSFEKFEANCEFEKHPIYKAHVGTVTCYLDSAKKSWVKATVH